MGKSSGKSSRFGVALLAGLFLLLQTFSTLASAAAISLPHDAFGRVICGAQAASDLPSGGDHGSGDHGSGDMGDCACCLCCAPLATAFVPPEAPALRLRSQPLVIRLQAAPAVLAMPPAAERPGAPRGPPSAT